MLTLITSIISSEKLRNRRISNTNDSVENFVTARTNELSVFDDSPKKVTSNRNRRQKIISINANIVCALFYGFIKSFMCSQVFRFGLKVKVKKKIRQGIKFFQVSISVSTKEVENVP